MKQSIRTYRKVIAVASLFALSAMSAPAFAGWSPASTTVFVGQTSYCHYRPSNSGNNRDARIKVQRFWVDLGEFGGFAVDDSVVRNRSASGGNADIFVGAWDNNNPPGSFLPYMVIFQNVRFNADKYLSAGMVANGYAPTYKSFLQSSGFVFGFRTDVNLQASCQVSNDG